MRQESGDIDSVILIFIAKVRNAVSLSLDRDKKSRYIGQPTRDACILWRMDLLICYRLFDVCKNFMYV